MPSRISESDRNRTDKMFLAIAVIIIVATAATLAAFVMLNIIHPSSAPPSTPKVEIIVDGNLTVNSGSYVYYNFTVFIGHLPVQGTFTVSGNDQKIRVYIMDSANFTNWQDTRNASKYYDSGESNSGNITATLPVGNYNLVYDNTFSATSKNVTTEVHSWYIPD